MELTMAREKWSVNLLQGLCNLSQRALESKQIQTRDDRSPIPSVAILSPSAAPAASAVVELLRLPDGTDDFC